VLTAQNAQVKNPRLDAIIDVTRKRVAHAARCYILPSIDQFNTASYNDVPDALKEDLRALLQERLPMKYQKMSNLSNEKNWQNAPETRFLQKKLL